MRFSLIYEAQTTDDSRAGDRKVFEELVEQVVLADKLDFDIVWCVEHTALTNYAHMSAPETFLAFVAGKTEKIGIGHGVVCLPPKMNHPIKVAERIATLDILSKGRVHFGVGKGGSQQEAGAFGYDLAELQPMIDESMYLIPKMFTQDFIEHDGKYIKIPKRPIHPKPYQDPHPPMYMACTGDDSLPRAASRGLGALVLGFGGPDDVARKNRLYREAYAKRKVEDQVGFRPIEHLAALCPALVLDDGDKARRIGIRGQRYFYESLAHWYTGGEKPDPSKWEEDLTKADDGSIIIKTRVGSEEVVMGGEKRKPSQEILNPNHAYGTVDDCINYVEKLIAAGADEILFMCNLGTIPQWAQLQTIQNIGRYVIPYFRARRPATKVAVQHKAAAE